QSGDVGGVWKVPVRGTGCQGPAMPTDPGSCARRYQNVTKRRRVISELGVCPETAVRGGGGAVSASIRRRRAGCLDRPPPAAPHRRSDGAPASPLRYSAHARAARNSPARREQAGDGPSSLHVPRRDEGARRMGPRRRRLNLRRLRARGVAAASPAGRPAVRNGAARERGRRRSAYEAPNGAGAPGPVSSGAGSKPTRCPRSRARQSRVPLLVWNDLSSVLFTFWSWFCWSGAGGGRGGRVDGSSV